MQEKSLSTGDFFCFCAVSTIQTTGINSKLHEDDKKIFLLCVPFKQRGSTATISGKSYIAAVSPFLTKGINS